MLNTKHPCDLLRGPPVADEQLRDVVPQRCTFLEPPLFRSPCLLVSSCLRRERPIDPTAAIRADLTPDRRTMTPDSDRDVLIGFAPVDPNPDLFTALERQRTFTWLAVA